MAVTSVWIAKQNIRKGDTHIHFQMPLRLFQLFFCGENSGYYIMRGQWSWSTFGLRQNQCRFTSDIQSEHLFSWNATLQLPGTTVQVVTRFLPVDQMFYMTRTASDIQIKWICIARWHCFQNLTRTSVDRLPSFSEPADTSLVILWECSRLVLDWENNGNVQTLDGSTLYRSAGRGIQPIRTEVHNGWLSCNKLCLSRKSTHSDRTGTTPRGEYPWKKSVSWGPGSTVSGPDLTFWNQWAEARMLDAAETQACLRVCDLKTLLH
jgi:hypothetical protein